MSFRTTPVLPAFAAAAIAASGVLAGCGIGGGESDSLSPSAEALPLAGGQEDARPAEAEPRPELPRGRGHIVARVRRAVLVYDRPDGTPVARLRRKTPFGEPRTLGVIGTRKDGRWVSVHSPVLENETRGWIENDPDRLELSRTPWSVGVWLGRREIRVRRGREVVRRIPIAIGRAGNDTPTGRYQVTDKLPGSRFPRGPYGCCVIALSARQPNLPDGWPGGDRIAIHGTPRDETIGSASSNGCLRASDADLRVLMRSIPVGAPVFIRP